MLLLLLLMTTLVHCEVLTRRAVLSPGHLELVWSPYQNHIILRVEARTLGYFALSFASVHGGGTQDALLGWTSDAEVLLQDGVVEARSGRIVADRVNDYELLEGARNESKFLSVTLQRRWSTCDQVEDLALGGGSVLLSWALYPRAPEDLDKFQRLEDGERHGSQVIVFNTPPSPLVPDTGLHVWPVIASQVRLTSNSSALKWCATFETPEMKDKHWIVGYRAEIKRSELVKHMVLLECRTDSLNSLEGGGRACTSTPPACSNIALVWTPGTQMTIFPSDIGIPVGASNGGADFYMLQISYSLPEPTYDDTDSSGMQILLTSKKPRHQAAILEIGVDRASILVLPPRQPWVSTRGWCFSSCLSKAVPRSGVTLVSLVLHANVAAQRLLLRHLHGVVELSPLAMELGYQSDQQEARILEPRVHLQSDDNLVLECQYNTQDRDRTTLGGVSAEDETCSAYLLYYPRTSLASCTSRLSNTFLDLLPIKQNNGSTTDSVSTKTKITREALQSIDWGTKNMTSKLDQINREILTKTTTPHCLNVFGDQMTGDKMSFELYQENLVPMNKVTRCGIWEKALRQERQRSQSSKFEVSMIIYIKIIIDSHYIVSIFLNYIQNRM